MNHLSNTKNFCPGARLMRFVLLTALLSAPLGIATAASEPAKEKSAGKPAASQAQPDKAQPATTPQAISFNRLLRVAPRRHLPPPEDGIHDPANDDTRTLQPPLEVYASLPRTQSDLGNGVSWVQAVDDGKIKPRWDRNDPAAEAMVMDMSVVRVPKGSMPDVVFPHRQHTQWLDCTNCHPAIFVPQQGANQISMAAILLGQKCGVCHGKVAFPISECRLCHSQPKKVAAAKGASKP